MRIPPTLTSIVLATLAIAAPGARSSDTIADFTRIRGQGESVLQGLGIVVGLPGTGDTGEDLVVARPLAQMLERLGNPVADLSELAQSQSAAVVIVTCTIPATGAMTDDTLDIRVSAYNAAGSLQGGELFLSPLVGPLPDDPLIYAFAQGPITLEDPETPTAGVVRGGARIVRDIVTTPDIAGHFDLVVHPAYVGYQAVSYLAELVEDEYLLTDSPTAERIAVALDPRTLRVFVPEVEQENIPAFVSQVLTTRISPELLGLPARVVCNTRTGSIVVDGEVEIAPALISHNDLVIQTTLPPPEPTPEAPIVENRRWAEVGTDPNSPTLGNVRDLLAALAQLNVAAEEQIDILIGLHRAGKLHGRLVVDGIEQ